MMRRRIRQVALVALLGCLFCCRRGGSGGEGDDVSTLDMTPPPGTANGGTTAPEPALAGIWAPPGFGLWQFATARRILQDGSVWHYRDAQDPDWVPGRKPARVPPEPAWWFAGERISPREVRQLREAIRHLGLLDLPMEPPGADGEVRDASPNVWTFAVPGMPPRDVKAFEARERPGLEAFARLFDAALHNAHMRWQRDRGHPHLPITPLPKP